MKNNKKQDAECAVRLKQARQLLEKNQKIFAQKLGFTNSYLCELEAGERNISTNVLMKLADLYDISPTWLLMGKGHMLISEYDNQQDIKISQLEPNLRKLVQYCQDSQYVNHMVLGHFIRLLHRDKKIIEDDINMKKSSGEKK